MTVRQAIDKISNRTAISIGLVVSLLGAAVLFASDYTAVKAQVNQSAHDIQNVFQQIKELNQNLITTNENLIRVKALLENR